MLNDLGHDDELMNDSKDDTSLDILREKRDLSWFLRKQVSNYFIDLHGSFLI